MSAQTLTITYAAAAIDRIENPYWIRIEQEALPDPAATVADAAAVLDALYDLDPCETATNETETETTEEAAEPPPEEEFAERVAEAIDLSFCTMDPDGTTETRIKIIRSHLAEPYRLQLQGGELIETIQQQEVVTRRGEINDQVTLDFPVIAGFSCSPTPLRRIGNTLAFAPELAGQTYTATYPTIYDLATIRIPGVDGEPGECRALAFCHGLVADETLETPELEAPDYSLCPDQQWSAPGEDKVTCYREIRVRKRCSCSGDIVSRETREETTPCPEGLRCSNNDQACMVLLESEAVDEWVACDGEDDSASDPAFYQRVCCRPPSVALPRCHQQRTTWKGGVGIEHGVQHYLDLYGPHTRIMPVSPAGGICGEWTIEQRRLGDDCCANVLPLEPDAEVNPEVMGDNGAMWIAVTGGASPYRFSTAKGLYFVDPATGRNVSSLLSEIRLILLHSAAICGTVTVNVVDGCDQTTTITIRAVTGWWDANPAYPNPDLGGHCSGGGPVVNEGGGVYSTTLGGERMTMSYTFPGCATISTDPRECACASCAEVDVICAEYAAGQYNNCGLFPDVARCDNLDCYTPSTASKEYQCRRLTDRSHWLWVC